VDADVGQPPATDHALLPQPLERGPHDLAERPNAEQPRRGRPVIGLELGVQQQQVDALHHEALHAGVQAVGELPLEHLRRITLALGGAAGHVGAGVGIDAQAHQQDGAQRTAELPVAAALSRWRVTSFCATNSRCCAARRRGPSWRPPPTEPCSLPGRAGPA
jgi:hypothetical protein